MFGIQLRERGLYPEINKLFNENYFNSNFKSQNVFRFNSLFNSKNVTFFFFFFFFLVKNVRSVSDICGK